MSMEIEKKDGKIIFSFPEFEDRFNPYDGESYDKYPTFTGLIEDHGGYKEMGFAQTIDMGYKDKGDQVGDFLVKWHNTEESFIKKCKELNISIHFIDYIKKCGECGLNDATELSDTCADCLENS